MIERVMWDIGIAAVRKEYGFLSPLLKNHLRKTAAAIKSFKQELYLAAEVAGAGAACATCFGECCKCGKNHVTVVDILVYLSDGAELFIPCFKQAVCPYIGKYGCLMPPEYRPYNCITFICEAIECGLRSLQKERFDSAERELKSLYEGLEQLFANGFRYGLLRNVERILDGEPAPILRGAALEKSGGQQGGYSDTVVNMSLQEECNWLL